MATLPTNEIIPDGVAKRLARSYRLIGFNRDGSIVKADIHVAMQARPNGACKDAHAFEADRRALLAYLVAKGVRGPVTGWEKVSLDDSVVPWSYGR